MSAVRRVFGAVSLVTALLGAPLLAVGLLPTARAAGAAVPVVVVFENDDDPVARRLRAELGGTAFDVHTAKIAFGVAPKAPLGGLAGVSAVAGLRGCLRVSHDDKSIEIWTAEGSGALQLVDVVDGKGDELAVRAAEVLRARLLPAPSGSSTTGGGPAPTTSANGANGANGGAPSTTSSASVSPSTTSSVDASSAPSGTATVPTEPRPPSIGVEVGPSIVVSPSGGVGALFDVVAGVRWAPTRDYAFRAFAMLPLTHSRIESDGGTVEVAATLVGVGAAVTLLDRQRIGANVGGGVAVSITHLNGSSRTPYTGRNLDVFGVVPYLRFSLPIHVERALSLEPAFTAGLLAPRASAHVVGQEVATFGPTLLVSEFVLTLEWP